MKEIIFFIVFFNFLNLSYLTTPIWEFENLAIDLFSIPSSPVEKITFSEGNYQLKKTITKNGNSVDISNTLIISGGSSKSVGFDHMDVYNNVHTLSRVICPKGSFHPYNGNGEQMSINDFYKCDDNWNLKCIKHSSGFFLAFYFNNCYKGLYGYSPSKGKWDGGNQFHEELFAVKIKDSGSDGKYPILFLGKSGEYLKLIGGNEILKNFNQENINRDSEKQRDILKIKDNTVAYFNENNDIFYFLTYDKIGFSIGYSETETISSYTDQNAINNVQITTKEDLTFDFVEKIEIIEMNFIFQTQNLYYTIKNTETNVIYHGVMEFKTQKILFNIDKELTKFEPYSDYEMLAITEDSAYKICLYKSGTECVNSCSNLHLDINGNECTNSGACTNYTMMPEEICIDSCDTNIFKLDNNICQLCKDFDSNEPYRIIGTNTCLREKPDETEFYNEKLYLLECANGYKLDSESQSCIQRCYPLCATCSDYSEDESAQKCTSCKLGYNIIDDNCIKITIPSTLVSPTTIMDIATTIVEISTTIKNVETDIVKNECKNKRCSTCNDMSDELGLCLSCDESKYKKVNYTKHFSNYFDCLEMEKLETKYYLDIVDAQYKPCYSLCLKCSGPGNASVHNCLECENNYMFRPGENPYNNCVVASEFYYLSPYNEYKPLNIPQCPEVAKYKIKNENNQTYCIYDCKEDKTYNYLYNGNCLKECPEGTIDDGNYICIENNPNKIYISNDQFYLDNTNESIKSIEILAKKYAEEFKYTENHISSFSNDEFNLLLYKNPGIIGQTELKAPDIDFGDCYKLVQEAYNITQNLIIAIADKKVKNNPSTNYLFFHPVSGIKLETSQICQNKSIKINENILTMLNEKSENYELQKTLTDQGINIFDINDPYYKDLCYDFDNPKNRDMALKDRIKETYVNVTLCDDGCINTGIDLVNKVATCDCKFNAVTNNDFIHENAAIEYLVGEFFDIINSSNILVLKCYKYLLKYFKRSIGGMIMTTLLILCIIFTVIFFSFEFTKMRRYIFSLTEKYTSFLANYSNVLKLFPPKRMSVKNKTIKEQNKEIKKNNTHRQKKQHTARTIIPYSGLGNQRNSQDLILSLKSGNSKLMSVKEKPEETGNSNATFIEQGKMIKKYFKDYLSTSPDDMEFDDAIKKDKRSFCGFFIDIIEEKQSLAYTFISSDPINTRMIKFILFSLNITLYFVVNGLFYSENYISELYHTDEKDETFFSFVPRTIDKIIYTTLVSIFIGYLTDFFFLDENKIKGIFKRDKENRTILKRNIAIFIREIQRRYLSFIIMTFVILIISLYYILCFNYVYPKTQVEWIKSSILIIIIMQILSLLKCLYEAIFRLLSFKCESDKLYKISKIFDNNS